MPERVANNIHALGVIEKHNVSVSVIIPAFNAEQFIVRTLQSVKDQSFPDFEVLVVDDGSNDATADLVSRFIADDSRFNLLRQNNKGSAAARNTGVAHSSGRYIAFLDADDLWHPQKLAKQVAVLEQAPTNTGLVYCWCVMINNADVPDGHFGSHQQIKGAVLNQIIVDNFVGNGSVALVRRDCLPTPPFDEDQLGNDDFLFYVRLASKWEFDVVPEYLVGYRWNTGHNKSRDTGNLRRSRDLALKKIARDMPHIDPKLIAWSAVCVQLRSSQVQFKKGFRYRALFDVMLTIAKCPSFVTSWPFRSTVRLVFRHISRLVYLGEASRDSSNLNWLKKTR